eukprot:GFUD01038069.1.p1 GENE.GFUD01038069.1~~GFUD01038069.1.p1  ORF type:complete len:283 (+),score=70.18 GFUD01038069.1:55-849(+)
MGDWQGEQTWSNYNQQEWNQQQSQDFQQFDYGNYGQTPTTEYGQPQTPSPRPPSSQSNPYLQPAQDTAYTGSMFIPDLQTPPVYAAPAGSSGFEDEPPLLEELGINPDHIMQKTLTVLNPMRSTDAAIAGDSDLAGPLVFGFAFGSFIMFSGKLYFNYIYGIGLLGCLAMYSLLNLMSLSGVSIGCVVSVLGYCLLPIVGLSGLSVLVSLSGVMGNILTGAAVAWCTLSSSKLFTTALEMKSQQLLVAYPCALLYGVFALITMF